MSTFGTWPAAITMAPFIKKLEKSAQIESIVCVTAQHVELLHHVLDILEQIRENRQPA